MYIQLVRESFTDKATEGKMFVNGEFECYTLEDMDRKLELPNTKKVYGETAIPRGKYRLIISYSKRFKRDLIEVLNVNGFTGVRIHTGNYAGYTAFLKKVKIKDKSDILLSEEYLKVV